MKTEAPHSRASAEKPWEVTETFWASLPGEAKAVYCWNVQGDDLWVTNIRKLEQARLIAAAPELLKALKTLVERIDNDLLPKGDFPGVPSGIARAKAAIAKAEGRHA